MRPKFARRQKGNFWMYLNHFDTHWFLSLEIIYRGGKGAYPMLYFFLLIILISSYGDCTVPSLPIEFWTGSKRHPLINMLAINSWHLLIPPPQHVLTLTLNLLSTSRVISLLWRWFLMLLSANHSKQWCFRIPD